jgi:SAM-dependent methyltransferase
MVMLMASDGLNDSRVRNSLAYRKNRPDIWDGKVPEKYLRLLPYIQGNRILEIGAAEGVLSLLMAATREVIAIEMRPERVAEGRALKAHWRFLGKQVDGCQFEVGDIRNRLDLLVGIDMIVAVRSIYYLREGTQEFVNRAKVPLFMMCGNKNRAAAWARGSEDSLGSYNFYASIEGMTQLLTTAGYEIQTVVTEGDPIVIGRHPSFTVSDPAQAVV